MNTSGSGRILVLGNDRGFMTSLCEILIQRDYHVKGVTTPQNMCRELKEQDFDLLLIDCDTSEEDFIHVFMEAKRINPHMVGVLIMNNSVQNSGYSKNGMFDYLVKPFKTEELFMKISRAMHLRLLQKSELLYRSVFENAAEGIYLVTRYGRYVLVNNAMAHIFGYGSPEGLMAGLNNCGHSLFAASEGRKKFVRLVRKEDDMSAFESCVNKKDGSPIWISESLRPVCDTEGKLLYYRGTIQDVTSRKRIEEELRESEKHCRLQTERSDRRNDVLLSIIDEMDGAYEDLEDLFMSFVRIIMNSLDEKRLWRKGHSERVAHYALGIAKEMGLHEDELRGLHLAALLHDIGKLWITEELIDKPSRLTDAEFESLKKHPVLGAEMFARVKQLKDIVPIIRHHHERYDGYGYPDGLKGDEIPLGARILHLADSFDSMTAQRPYRGAKGREYAFREFKRCRNAQFDPQLTTIALKVL